MLGLNISRSSLGRLVNRTNKLNHKREDKNTKNCTKLLIFHQNTILSNYAYILMANTKTKIFHISWIDKADRNKLFDHLCNILLRFNNDHILLSRESDDYQNYQESLRKIHVDKNVVFEFYTETGLANISQEELIRSLSLVISQLTNDKHRSFNFVFRAFRYIYNYKTPLSSLRKNTPKQLAL